ncbi:mitochondrial carrier domain-containing protein [Circinella umbellata]|nr:mitochondrial carrier domain-containing protein [Circinella umbellata]
MTTVTKKRSTPFYFGGAASCVATVIVHPFDLTKVRLQNMKGQAQHGMVSTMLNIARKEGFFRLYAGLSASLLRQATYSTVRFGAYDKLKQNMVTDSKSNILQLLVCSSTAGALGGASGNPADVLNVRMQSDGQLPVHQRRNYKNAIDGLVRMTKEEGPKSLFRGIGPNVNRAILMTSSQCVTYDIFKDLLLTYSPLSDGLVLHFASSLLAGLVATSVCSPVDVIKTRIMGSKEVNMSAFSIMKQMYKVEGITSFFKGWTPAFIRLGPQTIITFVVLEQFKKWHAAWHDDDRQRLTATATATTKL